MKTKIFFLLMVLCMGAKAQDSEYFENFDNNSLSSIWAVTGSTFSISGSDAVMKVNYNRTATSGQWDQFNLSGISVKAGSPYISIDLKSNTAFKLAVKPVSSAGDDWMEALVPNDSKWHNYLFKLSKTAGTTITNIYIYFDGGSSAIKSGLIEIDNFHLGIKDLPKDTSLLSQLFVSATNFESNIMEGEEPGQFPIGSKNLVQIVADSANKLISVNKSLSQGYIDSACFNLFDELTKIEISAHKPATKLLIDTFSSYPTYLLYKNLQLISEKRHTLFGMHDATAYGIGWSYDGVTDQSDVKLVTGSHPAILSQDANDIIANSASSIAPYKKRQMDFYLSGGINTLVWHMADPVYNTFYYDNLTVKYNVVETILPNGKYHKWYTNNLRKLALYFKSFKGPKGETVPFIFRPFHEHNGNWFWWGKTRCTVDQYNQIWKFTVEYLRDSLNVHNLIYAISPDGNQYTTKQDYKAIYPGDAYIDVFGLDYYFGENTTTAVNKLKSELIHITEFAKETGKLAALTEFGDRLGWGDVNTLKIPSFYTRMVLPAIKGITNNGMVAYAATWRNGGTTHFFAPYPGHAQVPDFLNFYDDTTILFLNDIKNLYSSGNDFEKPANGSRIKTFTVSGIKAVVDIWLPTADAYKIKLQVPDTMNLSASIPDIQISEKASLKLNGTPFNSGQIVDLEQSLKLTVIAENGIDSAVYTLEITKNQVTSIKDENNKLVLMYPNPFKDILYVEANSGQRLKVFNNMGQNIMEISLIQGNNQFNLAHLSKGIYLFKLIDADSELNRLIIKN